MIKDKYYDLAKELGIIDEENIKVDCCKDIDTSSNNYLKIRLDNSNDVILQLSNILAEQNIEINRLKENNREKQIQNDLCWEEYYDLQDENKILRKIIDKLQENEKCE